MRAHSGAVAEAALPSADALAAAARLRGWFEQVALVGVDPYDALRSPALRSLGRTQFLRQVAIQGLRRSPFDPRPLLGIRPYANAKGLGIVAAASARLWALTGDPSWRELAERAADVAAELSLETPSGPAWGYPFDVQVRWAYYREGTPNAIASVFTAGGLIVTGTVLDRPDLVEKGEAVVHFLDSLATSDGASSFYAYVPGNRTPIHNANLLVAALRARLCSRRNEKIPVETEAAIEYSLGRQKADGSWPYGEGAGLGWVDGYHTAYVLLALRDLGSASSTADVEAALSRGLRFYIEELFDQDGMPLIGPRRLYPVDAHNVATALTTLVRMSDREPRAAKLARRAFEVAVTPLQAKGGWFMYQRGRVLSKRVAYLRWSNAHMLNALAELARLEAEAVSGPDAAAPVP